MQILSWSTPEQTQAWVKKITAELRRPCVVLLSGPLGAGKTQIVKWFLREIGLSDGNSPTFAIHHRYDSVAGAVDHVDLYRLKSDADLESSGFWDLLSEPRGLVFVEWADRLPRNSWPAPWRKIFVDIEVNGPERKVKVEILGG